MKRMSGKKARGRHPDEQDGLLMKGTLDDIDHEIIGILQRDGRITNADLAKRVGLSPPSVLQRVRKLEKGGFITGYAAFVDPDKLGLKVTVFAMVSLSLHQDQPIERFRNSILEIPEIVECYHVSGEFDFLLKIRVADIRAYEALVREHITRIKDIRQVKSCFVLASIQTQDLEPVA